MLNQMQPGELLFGFACNMKSSLCLFSNDVIKYATSDSLSLALFYAIWYWHSTAESKKKDLALLLFPETLFNTSKFTKS